jgi:hypothetical protein
MSMKLNGNEVDTSTMLTLLVVHSHRFGTDVSVAFHLLPAIVIHTGRVPRRKNEPPKNRKNSYGSTDLCECAFVNIVDAISATLMPYLRNEMSKYIGQR